MGPPSRNMGASNQDTAYHVFDVSWHESRRTSWAQRGIREEFRIGFAEVPPMQKVVRIEQFDKEMRVDVRRAPQNQTTSMQPPDVKHYWNYNV